MKKYIFTLVSTLLLLIPGFTQSSVLNFDGVNDYVDLGSNVGTGVRTIELWFNPSSIINSSINDFKTLVARNNPTSNANEFNITFSPTTATPYSASGSLRFAIYDGNLPNTITHSVYSNSKFWNANQWYHVAAVVHPIQGMMLFIDGTKQNSTNSYIAATVSQQASTTIGSWQNVSSRHFNGLIDDVRFSDSALYTSNFSTNCFGLTALNSSLALYNFNDNLSLLILKDSTINNNNGIIHGATYRIDDICGVTFLGNVLNFDGVNDYVDLGSNAGTGVRTIELWFNPSFVINRRINHFKTLIARNNHTSNANEFNITFSPVTATPSSASGSLRFAIYDGNLTSTTTYSIYSNSKVWNANQWYHLAAVVHPIQGMMLFIDGVKQNSTNPYSFATVFQQASTTIGSWQNAPTRYFSGLIDDVRFSDSALYTSSFSTSCPDSKASSSTIALFNFNDSSNVLITIDSSGNMNNGIIYGARVSKDLICPTITDITKSRKGANFLNVYPNPFYNQLHFEIETTYNSTYAVKIFNINCKAIIQIDNYESRQSINVSHLSKGLYFYVVTSGQNFVKSGKLIKN